MLKRLWVVFDFNCKTGLWCSNIEFPYKHVYFWSWGSYLLYQLNTLASYTPILFHCWILKFHFLIPHMGENKTFSAGLFHFLQNFAIHLNSTPCEK